MGHAAPGGRKVDGRAGKERCTRGENAAHAKPRILGAMASDGRFVLVQPSHAGNVGAAARALKVMGFADLVLVAPRFADVQQMDEARAMASGAQDVLDTARVVPTLDAALDGITWACATAMTPRDFGPPTFAPREHLAELAAGAHAAAVAFVFGTERVGLSNDEVYRCQACLSIPTDPRYGSLNLAQAVQLVAYDWRQALGGFAVQARTAPRLLADAQAVQGLLEHWQQVLVEIGFLDPAAPKKLLPRLQQLLGRAQLGAEEVHILRGIARAVAEHPRSAARRRQQD
jgi:tRNA/rRNA methyltransferase